MKKPKKSRPLDLHAYLVGKLRAATRKWPPFNQVKAASKVAVTAEYIETADGKFLRATVASTGEVVLVPVHKQMQNRERVMYRCKECERLFFDYEYLPTKKGGLKKTAMIAIDHVQPIVDPKVGFVDWDVYIKRMFEGELQVLCNYPGLRDGKPSCHHAKTALEKGDAVERRRAEKKIIEL